MTTLTANIILVIMAATWGVLSYVNGYFMPVSNDFLWVAGLLASGNIGTELIKKYGVTPK